jgi:hypothetical protein
MIPATGVWLVVEPTDGVEYKEGDGCAGVVATGMSGILYYLKIKYFPYYNFNTFEQAEF